MVIHRLKSNLKSFHNQLEEVCSVYPRLNIIRTYQENYLEGVLEVFDEEGNLFNEFHIEIHNSNKYPYRFPILYEVGGKIPHSQEWHVFASMSGVKKPCCITVPPIEAITCKTGISILRYIETEVKPYLYKQAYRLMYGYYPGREFEHGPNGLWQYYGELFDSSNKGQILRCLSAYSKKLHKKTTCYCGSGRKFKECHPHTYKSLRTIPKDLLADHIIMLTANC